MPSLYEKTFVEGTSYTEQCLWFSNPTNSQTTAADKRNQENTYGTNSCRRLSALASDNIQIYLPSLHGFVETSNLISQLLHFMAVLLCVTDRCYGPCH